MFVFLYLLHAEHRNTHSAGVERVFLGCEDIFAGPLNLKCLFEGVKTALRLGLDLDFGWGLGSGLVGMVWVWGWVIHYFHEGPHKEIQGCECLYCILDKPFFH